jgi:hypothetical protein
MYYIEISANTCTCKISINGLGIDELDAKKVGSVQYPCNTELIGKGNKVAVEVMPASIDLTTLNKIAVEGEVKKYPDNGFIGPESGAVIASFSLTQTIEMIKANPFANIADLVPFKITAEFDSEDAPSLEDRLIKAKPIENAEALKDWAMTFRSLLEKRDIDGLYVLYEPKLIDYDIAYPAQKEPDNKIWFANWMNNKIFTQNPFTGFSRDVIETTKWCDGRIWEICLKGGQPLWSTEGLDGKRTKIQVYVGLVDGKIKIVR